MQPTRYLKTHGIIGLVRVQRQQVLLHTTYRTVYRHVVIVQDNQQVVVARCDVVQPLVGQTTAHGAVTNHGYHMALLTFVGDGHTQRCTDTVRGMTTHKGVVFTLLWSGEGTDTPQLSVGEELLATTSQNLMTVGLMAHVPYNPILWGVVHIVECHGNLGNT